MTKIGIIFHSAQGHTKAMAEHIQIGASKLAETRMYDCTQPVDFDFLDACDAIIFGCPTYMGSVSGELKSFMDSTSAIWSKRKWRNKIAAGFTDSSALNGDKLSTLMQLSLFAFQHGMIWVGLDLLAGISSSRSNPDSLNRLGSWIGLMSQSNSDEDSTLAPPESDRRTAEYFGERIANIAQSFRSK